MTTMMKTTTTPGDDDAATKLQLRCNNAATDWPVSARRRQRRRTAVCAGPPYAPPETEVRIASRVSSGRHLPQSPSILSSNNNNRNKQQQTTTNNNNSNNNNNNNNNNNKQQQIITITKRPRSEHGELTRERDSATAAHVNIKQLPSARRRAS